jgi:hypothetical protein
MVSSTPAAMFYLFITQSFKRRIEAYLGKEKALHFKIIHSSTAPFSFIKPWIHVLLLSA